MVRDLPMDLVLYDSSSGCSCSCGGSGGGAGAIQNLTLEQE